MKCRARWKDYGCALALAIAFASGCGSGGPALQPIKGSVKINGKPAAQAIVFMHRKQRDSPLEPVPYGTTAADGSFVVLTPPDAKGAQTGDYVLTVYIPDLSKPEDRNGQRPDLLNRAYLDPASSHLAFTVKQGQNTIPELDLQPGRLISTPASDANIK